MTTEIIQKPTKNKRLKTPEKKIVDLIGNHKLTPSEAAKILGVHPNAVYQALQRYKIDLSGFDIDSIKTSHESELIAINALARGRIFDKLLNDNNLGLIEITACLDRTFQQLRELQGKGHSSINILTMIISRADEQILKVSTSPSTPDSNNQHIVQQALEGTIS